MVRYIPGILLPRYTGATAINGYYARSRLNNSGSEVVSVAWVQMVQRRRATSPYQYRHVKEATQGSLVGHGGHLEHSAGTQQDLFFARVRACAGGAV